MVKTIVKRLFVGNISQNASSDDLKSRFVPFGTVKNVEIKTKKDIDGKVLSFFAFVDIDSTEDAIQKCVNECSGAEWWKGHTVRVQIAKESFMTRLAKERQEAESSISKKQPIVEARLHKGAPYKKILMEEEVTDFGDKVPDGESSNGVVKFDDETIGKPEVRRPRKYYSSSSDEDEPNEGVRKKPKIPKYSGGAFMRKLESFDSQFWTNDDDSKKKSLRQSKKGSENANLEPLGPQKTYSEDLRLQNDNKRIESLKQRQEEFKERRNLVKSALKSSNTFSKVIRFNNDEDNEEKKPHKKISLFDENEDEDENETFKDRPEFEGASGQRLFELESRFGGDLRFKMNKHFADVGSKDQPTLPQKSKEFSETRKLRYDPSQEVEAMELENDLEKNINSDNIENTKKEASMNHEVLKSKFFEVSTGLKDAFKGKSGAEQGSSSFSLLKTFGKPDSSSHYKPDSVESLNKPRKLDTFSSNPFQYDSTDEEDAEDSAETNKEAKPKNLEFTNLLKPSKNSGEKFFFNVQDQRFEEGLQFLAAIETISSEEVRTKYEEEERPILASIMKKKLRNKAKSLEKKSFGFSSSKKKKGKIISKIRKKHWNKKKKA